VKGDGWSMCKPIELCADDYIHQNSKDIFSKSKVHYELKFSSLYVCGSYPKNKIAIVLFGDYLVAIDVLDKSLKNLTIIVSLVNTKQNKCEHWGIYYGILDIYVAGDIIIYYNEYIKYKKNQHIRRELISVFPPSNIIFYEDERNPSGFSMKERLELSKDTKFHLVDFISGYYAIHYKITIEGKELYNLMIYNSGGQRVRYMKNMRKIDATNPYVWVCKGSRDESKIFYYDWLNNIRLCNATNFSRWISSNEALEIINGKACTRKLKKKKVVINKYCAECKLPLHKYGIGMHLPCRCKNFHYKCIFDINEGKKFTKCSICGANVESSHRFS